MTIKIRAKHIILDKNLKVFIQGKILALSRFAQDINLVEVELLSNKHHKKGQIYTAEIQLRELKKKLIAREKSTDLYSAINLCYENIARQIRKLKKKKEETNVRKARKWVNKIKEFIPDRVRARKK